jgi:imidazolonepropionase-like amidohydrolase
MSGVCVVAHRRGLTVGCHAESTEGVREALLGGVDTIEHGAAFDDEIISLFLNNPNSLRGYSSYIPTLSAPENIIKNKDKLQGWDEVKLTNAELVFSGQKSGVQQAIKAGIKTGCGTDSGVPFVTHYNVWEELELLMKYGGITPAAALETATIATAGILGIDDICGSITAGKQAEMIVLNDNPLERIETLAVPFMVAAGKTLIRSPRVKKLKLN